MPVTPLCMPPLAAPYHFAASGRPCRIRYLVAIPNACKFTFSHLTWLVHPAVLLHGQLLTAPFND